ncbi:TWiK family of potassium channels protein 18-like isoform X2 [Mercenaria mercenaria]|uniref:TWiK family of potassium channels protein 18-like isoform X2 n=1 Tax=Mercenaria mercenaria TaxID=6596 RepID=UPI00234EDA78|nr:TWiK family of potassium channels protein 18-like isoform X2 [Mercenaria mercenaria]
MSQIKKQSVLLRKLTTMEDGKATSVSLETLEVEEADDSKNNSTENLDNSCLGKARRILRTVYKGARSLVGLAVILIVYALLGALVFMLIESRHEQKYKSNITNIRENMIEGLLLKSTGVVDKVTWKTETKALLLEYESSIREAINNDVPTDSTEEVWTMWSSLFFVFTVFTTIGYGNLAPVTGLGRVLCIVYAGIGIPLALLLLAELGRRFTVVLKFLWAYGRRYYNYGYCRKVRERNPFQKKYELNEEQQQQGDEETKSEDGKSEDRSRSGSRIIYGYEVDDAFNVPITIAILILFVYILLGALMYSIWEDWDFIEAIYFVFVSLSTIGFGDILPAHQKFFVVSSIYMFIGLSLVSMCINVAIEFFNVAAVRAKRKVGEAKKKIGDKAKQAHRTAKEKVADIKTNIADETTKFKQKTDDKVKKLKTNIADETSKLRHKTDEKISGIKSNISEETTKFRKKADDKFRKKNKDRADSSPSIGHPMQQTDDTYDEIGTVKSETEIDKL